MSTNFDKRGRRTGLVDTQASVLVRPEAAPVLEITTGSSFLCVTAGDPYRVSRENVLAADEILNAVREFALEVGRVYAVQKGIAPWASLETARSIEDEPAEEASPHAVQ